MALYEQWLSYQKQSLNNKGVNLDNISDEDISMYYFEYYFFRTLQKIPYTVYLSDELVENPLYENFKDVIDNICHKAKNADDLIPYLSKGIKRIQRPDKMLNDWGVLHFHLGENIDASGFITRTNELLFIYRDIYRPNELYFLDIFNHGDWSKKRTIEIIKNNWSDVLEPYQIKSLIDIEPKLNDDEHLSVRQANINSAITFDDETAYLTIGGGLTAIGTNIESTKSKIYFMKYFQRLEKKIIDTYTIHPNTIELRLDYFPHIYINQHYLNENVKVIPLDITIPRI